MLWAATAGLIVVMGSSQGFCAETTVLPVQPIFTRYAQTAARPYINGTLKYFEGLQLQEAKDFDGWGAGIDITVPIREQTQLRLVLPLYTSGTATRTEPPFEGLEIDIEGDGGVFDFASVIFERQVTRGSHKVFTYFPNLAYFVGAGTRAGGLETSAPDKDIYNHTGHNVVAGVKVDRFYSQQQIQFAGNVELRYYFRSDDLHPADDRDSFTMLAASASAIFRRWHSVYPAAELVLQKVKTEHNSLLLVPELIAPLTRKVAFKVGIPVGLTKDGEQLGLRLQWTGEF